MLYVRNSSALYVYPSLTLYIVATLAGSCTFSQFCSTPTPDRIAHARQFSVTVFLMLGIQARDTGIVLLVVYYIYTNIGTDHPEIKEGSH